MEFSRPEYWSGLPFRSLGNLPNAGIEPGSPTLWADALISEPPGKTLRVNIYSHIKRANLLEKTLMLGKTEQEEKRVTENEMIGCLHRLNGHEFEQTPGNSKG